MHDTTLQAITDLIAVEQLVATSTILSVPTGLDGSVVPTQIGVNPTGDESTSIRGLDDATMVTIRQAMFGDVSVQCYPSL